VGKKVKIKYQVHLDNPELRTMSREYGTKAEAEGWILATCVAKGVGEVKDGKIVGKYEDLGFEVRKVKVEE